VSDVYVRRGRVETELHAQLSPRSMRARR
jgi:hypothetical protein